MLLSCMCMCTVKGGRVSKSNPKTAEILNAKRRNTKVGRMVDFRLTVEPAYDP